MASNTQGTSALVFQDVIVDIHNIPCLSWQVGHVSRPPSLPTPAMDQMGNRCFEVTAQTVEGRYKTTLRAAHPVDAALQVMTKLGFGEKDDHHPPFALTVVPLGARHARR